MYLGARQLKSLLQYHHIARPQAAGSCAYSFNVRSFFIFIFIIIIGSRIRDYLYRISIR